MNWETVEEGAKAYVGERWGKSSIREQVSARRIARRILEAALQGRCQYCNDEGVVHTHEGDSSGPCDCPASQIDALKQGIWEMAGISGADLDGQRTYHGLSFPDIVTFGKQAVQSLRDSYEEALKDVPLNAPTTRRFCSKCEGVMS